MTVLGKHKHQPSRSAHHVTKVFFLCRSLGGQFIPNNETLASCYFALDDLPEQIKLCYEAYQAEHWKTVFD